MAWGYRNRRRYYRRRYYRRGYGSRGATRRAYGNMRAAKQQADNATFTLNVPTKFATFMKSHTHIDGTPALEQNTTGVYPISIYDLLRRSEFFNNYANMYDEFKIDKIKVKLLPTAFTVNTNGNYRSLTVYTAWDRTGLNATQVRSIFDKQHPQNNKIYCTIGEDITTYSSAESRTVNPGANTSITRWLNPKTITEKSQWLSTALLKKWYEEYNDDLGCFTGIKFDGDDYDLAQISTVANDLNSIIKWSACAKDNPCFLLEDPSIKFKPTLLVGVYPPIRADDTTNTSNKIHFNVETEIVCTYRGLRKGKVLSTGEQSSQQLIVGPKPTVIRSDGTYNARSDGLDGYSSVTVEVGGGENPGDNHLAFVLNNEIIESAKQRQDHATTGGESLNNVIDWPKLGEVNWGQLVSTLPDANAKYVDAAIVNVGAVVLPSEWTQATPLTLAAVRTKYQDMFDSNNAVYPENFEFTPRYDIPYNNNTAPGTNTIVRLENTNVNCMNQLINVGDITATQYAGEQPTDEELQAEVDANPIINPTTHGAYVNTENGVNYYYFTFQLPDGLHVKTDPTDPDGMKIELPRLYGNQFEGKFRLPQGAQNQRITQPGRYIWGNVVQEASGQPQIWEVAPAPASNSSNLYNLPKTVRAIRVGDTNNNDNLFTLGSFEVDIPSIPEITTFNVRAVSGGVATIEYDYLSDWNTLTVGQSVTETFNPGVEKDVGYWICVFVNKEKGYYGGFTFNVGEGDYTQAQFNVNLVNTENSATDLLYTFLNYEPTNEGQNPSYTTLGFGTADETYLPLCMPINTPDTVYTLNPGESGDIDVHFYSQPSPANLGMVQQYYNKAIWTFNNEAVAEPESTTLSTRSSSAKSTTTKFKTNSNPNIKVVRK